MIGLPWLQKHDPTIKWGERKITFSSPFCKKNCLKRDTTKARDKKGRFVAKRQEMQEQEFDEVALDALIKKPPTQKESKIEVTGRPQRNQTHIGNISFSKEEAEGLTGRQTNDIRNPPTQSGSGSLKNGNKKAESLTRKQELQQLAIDEMVIDTLVEGPIEHHKPGQEHMRGVPAEYHDFADVFDLKKARVMPKDRGIWNFKIDFIKGWEDKLPKPAKRYWLTKEEQELEKETITELLEAGMICPSKSPIAAPCFFVPKKDGTKRHIVDWRGINAITVKDAHPLPIMDDLLDLVKGSKIMSKLNLTASYNQIPIREQGPLEDGVHLIHGIKQIQRHAFWVCKCTATYATFHATHTGSSL